MHKILIAEPIYQALVPDVYHNRIWFWRDVWVKDAIQRYHARPITLGPRRAIRSARDVAIREAIANGATHVMFLDDDIKTPPDILSLLLDANKPIIGGLIHRDDGAPIVFRLGTETDNSEAMLLYAGHEVGETVWRDHPKTGVFGCAAVGAGCMLIRAEVLHNIIETDRWAFNYDDTERSMDVRFCRRARKAGFSVWCYPDKPCEQIKHYAV